MGEQIAKNNLPKGWTRASLKEIGIASGQSIFPARNPDEVFELWSVPNFDLDKPEYLKGKEIGSNKCIVKENDILLCKINPRINRVWKVRKAGKHRQIASTEWVVIRNEANNQDFIVYQLRSSQIRNEILKDVSGVGGSLMRARPNSIKELKIVLPPIEIQNRLVSKIDQLFSELDKGIESLLIIQQQLKTYRQSVLKWAFEGKLTNEKVQDGNLPKGWKWVKMSDVCKKIGDIDHKMPKQHPTGYPYVSTKDFTDNLKISFDKVKYISKEDYEALGRKIKPEKGDIIFPRYGTIGKNILVDFDKLFLVSYSCAIIKPNHDLVLSNYVYLYSLSPKITDEIRKYVVETTQANIGINSIKEFVFPLPTLQQQEEVIQAIESRLSVADKMEETITQSLQQAETLRQSILKQAFEGKLL